MGPKKINPCKIPSKEIKKRNCALKTERFKRELVFGENYFLDNTRYNKRNTKSMNDDLVIFHTSVEGYCLNTWHKESYILFKTV